MPVVNRNVQSLVDLVTASHYCDLVKTFTYYCLNEGLNYSAIVQTRFRNDRVKNYYKSADIQ